MSSLQIIFQRVRLYEIILRREKCEREVKRMQNLCSWRKSLQASHPLKKKKKKKEKRKSLHRLLILSNPPAVQDCLCKASRMEQKIYFLAGSQCKQQIRFCSLFKKFSKSHCHVVYSECVLGCSEGESTFDK